MKRFNAFILLVFCIAFVSAAAFPAAAESGYIRGDADGDGKVSIRDVTEIQRKLVNIPTPNFNEKAADIDSNGLDITDATNIQRYLAEFDDSYHIGESVSDNTKTTRDEYELPYVPY